MRLQQAAAAAAAEAQAGRLGRLEAAALKLRSAVGSMAAEWRALVALLQAALGQQAQQLAALAAGPQAAAIAAAAAAQAAATAAAETEQLRGELATLGEALHQERGERQRLAAAVVWLQQGLAALGQPAPHAPPPPPQGRA